MNYIQPLTGLRGLAALIVFVSHSANESILPKFLGNGFGQMGVMLFFVLSGFLMAHIYLGSEFNKYNIKRYVLARICRVFPLYFLLIFLSIFISSYIDPDFYYNFYSYGQIIKSLLFIRAPYVFWTIPVEVQFYFVFILFWFFYTKGTKYSLLFVLVIFIILPCYIYFYKDIQLPKSIASYSLAFFIGSVTSLFYTNIQGNEFLKKYSSHITLSVFLLICINLPGLRNAFIFDFSDGIYARTWGDPITCILVYCLFICVLLNNKYLNFLESKPFIMLGNISYGFYLMHYPIIIYVKSFTLFLPLKFIVAFLITATLAYLSNRYFERYAAREIRRIL